MTFFRLLIATVCMVSFSYNCNAKNIIKPFTTDGCSSFPNGTIAEKELWMHCCTRHDKSYWQGGVYEERVVADNALKECVEKVGNGRVAQLMLLGVRVGGTPYLPTKFRWGYGWPYVRGYKKLSKEESDMVKVLLSQ
jgi:hypothetical protein